MTTINKPKSMTNQIVEAIGRRIVSGYYGQCEKLPSEAFLCEEFHVSRPILREVFKVLSAKGLITSQPRIGSRVEHRDRWALLDRDVLEWTIHAMPEAEFLDMIFEVRHVFEPQTAALAAHQATRDDRGAITAAMEAMESAEAPQALLDPDLDFHLAIANSTHNDLVAHIARTLHGALAASIRMTSRHPDTHERSLPRHRAIHDAIMARDAGEAAAATRRLLKESRCDFDDILKNHHKGGEA